MRAANREAPSTNEADGGGQAMGDLRLAAGVRHCRHGRLLHLAGRFGIAGCNCLDHSVLPVRDFPAQRHRNDRAARDGVPAVARGRPRPPYASRIARVRSLFLNDASRTLSRPPDTVWHSDSCRTTTLSVLRTP